MIAKYMKHFDDIQTISSYFLLISLAFHVHTTEILMTLTSVNFNLIFDILNR